MVAGDLICLVIYTAGWISVAGYLSRLAVLKLRTT